MSSTSVRVSRCSKLGVASLVMSATGVTLVLVALLAFGSTGGRNWGRCDSPSYYNGQLMLREKAYFGLDTVHSELEQYSTNWPPIEDENLCADTPVIWRIGRTPCEAGQVMWALGLTTVILACIGLLLTMGVLQGHLPPMLMKVAAGGQIISAQLLIAGAIFYAQQLSVAIAASCHATPEVLAVCGLAWVCLVLAGVLLILDARNTPVKGVNSSPPPSVSNSSLIAVAPSQYVPLSEYGGSEQ